MSGMILLPFNCFKDGRLTPSDIRVLAAISYFSCPASEICAESRRELMLGAGIKNDSTVSTSLSRLKKCGWIEQVGNTRPPQYRVINADLTLANDDVSRITTLRNDNVSEQGCETTTLEAAQGCEMTTLAPPQSCDTATLAAQGCDSTTLAKSIYINIYNINNTDSDQIRSDVDEVVFIQALTENGVDKNFIKQDDAGIISQWVSDGFTSENLRSACIKAKANKPSYFAPRYIDRVLRSNFKSSTELSARSSSLADGYGMDVVGATS